MRGIVGACEGCGTLSDALISAHHLRPTPRVSVRLWSLATGIRHPGTMGMRVGQQQEAVDAGGVYELYS